MLCTTVDALAVLKHVVAHGLDLESVEEMHKTDCVDLRPLLGNLLEEVFLDRGDLALTLELALDEKCSGESLASFGTHEVHLVRGLRDVLDLLVSFSRSLRPIIPRCFWVSISAVQVRLSRLLPR